MAVAPSVSIQAHSECITYHATIHFSMQYTFRCHHHHMLISQEHVQHCANVVISSVQYLFC